MADSITKILELDTTGTGKAVLDWEPTPEVEAVMDDLKNYFLDEADISEEGAEGILGMLQAANKIRQGKAIKTPEFGFTDDDLTELILGEDVIGFETNLREPLGIEDAILNLKGRHDDDDSSLSARLNLAFHGGGTVQVDEEYTSPPPIKDPLPYPQHYDYTQPRRNPWSPGSKQGGVFEGFNPDTMPFVAQPPRLLSDKAPITNYLQPLFRSTGGLIDQIQRPEIYGRGDDTMMMHVTPDEVRGLMSLFPGAITQNPYTGYPEAGGLGDMFKKILPILAIAAITYFTMGTGTGPALGAMGGTTAATAGSMGTAAGASGLLAAGAGGTAGGWMAAGGAATAAGFTGASAIPAAAGAYPAMSTAAMSSAAAPYSGAAGSGLGGAGFSGSSPAALQASMAGAETVPTAYGTYGPTTSKGFATNEAAVKAAKGPDYGDAIRRLANQANQQEEEQPPPQTPMSVEPLQRKDTGLDEIIAASAEELQAPQTPGIETSGLGLGDPESDLGLGQSVGIGDVSDEELEEAIIGYRKGGTVNHGGMLVGPSSTLTTGGGLVVGGKMNKDGTFPVDGVHTQIHDGRGKAVQEARRNNGEVVISGGGVAGLGKLMGAPPNKETEAGADYLMQLQRKAESMNKGGTHLSPTNMRPSYGFGLR